MLEVPVAARPLAWSVGFVLALQNQLRMRVTTDLSGLTDLLHTRRWVMVLRGHCDAFRHGDDPSVRRRTRRVGRGRQGEALADLGLV